MQILAGPRQVGKTTIARAAAAASGLPHVYASADGPSPPGTDWIDRQWDKAVREGVGGCAILVLDEVQKVPRWSEVVKARWDDDTHHGRPIRVVLLGSAPLLVQQGLTESLAGRFELIRVPHWSFPEMREAFGWDLDRYVLFGGYPGAAPLVVGEDLRAPFDAGELQRASREALCAEAMEHRLELRALDDTAWSVRESAKLSRAASLPRLDAFGNAYYANQIGRAHV